jgi:CRISPR system Cascade subunit CasD
MPRPEKAVSRSSLHSLQTNRMQYLAFRLYAPLASWGEVAVGEVRSTASYPGRSALLGLFGAALGLDRSDETGHLKLRDSYGIVVGVVTPGRLLRDYHTAQVPGRASLKRRPHRTRRDELILPKDELNTVLSTRDYRQDALSIIVIWEKPGALHSLAILRMALRQPKYSLYLGRKACPPALPLCPQMVDASNVRDAFSNAEFPLEVGLTHDEQGQPFPVSQLVWGDDAEMGGFPPTLTVPRKDHLLSRQRWQFGDRMEHIAVLSDGV